MQARLKVRKTQKVLFAFFNSVIPSIYISRYLFLLEEKKGKQNVYAIPPKKITQTNTLISNHRQIVFLLPNINKYTRKNQKKTTIKTKFKNKNKHAI